MSQSIDGLLLSHWLESFEVCEHAVWRESQMNGLAIREDNAAI